MAGDLETYATNIMKAREAVKQAMTDYSRGRGVKQLNAAQEKLADANHAYWQCSGGLAQDR